MTASRLPLGRKVIELAGETRPYLTPAERAALLTNCPRPYDRTLDAILALAGRSGRLFAGIDSLAARAKLSRRSVQVHRRWLVANGYLIPQGGGHRGATARYLIATPALLDAHRLAVPPPAWQRITDPELRADALKLEGL